MRTTIWMKAIVLATGAVRGGRALGISGGMVLWVVLGRRGRRGATWERVEEWRWAVVIGRGGRCGSGAPRGHLDLCLGLGEHHLLVGPLGELSVGCGVKVGVLRLRMEGVGLWRVLVLVELGVEGSPGHGGQPRALLLWLLLNGVRIGLLALLVRLGERLLLLRMEWGVVIV